MDSTRPSQAVLTSLAFTAGVATVIAATVVCDFSCLSRSLIDNVRRRITRGLQSLGERLSPQERSKRRQIPGDSSDCQGFPDCEADGETEAEAETKEVAVEPAYHLPLWFLKNCVVTSEDLRISAIPFIIRDTTLDTKDQEESYYELDAAVFEELRNLIQKKPSSEAPTGSQQL